MKVVYLVFVALLFVSCNDTPTKTPEKSKVSNSEVEKRPTGIKHTIAPARKPISNP